MNNDLLGNPAESNSLAPASRHFRSLDKEYVDDNS